MYKMWRDHTLFYIKNDFNMIKEEFNFWSKCQPKDQRYIVQTFFSEEVRFL